MYRREHGVAHGVPWAREHKGDHAAESAHCNAKSYTNRREQGEKRLEGHEEGCGQGRHHLHPPTQRSVNAISRQCLDELNTATASNQHRGHAACTPLFLTKPQETSAAHTQSSLGSSSLTRSQQGRTIEIIVYNPVNRPPAPLSIACTASERTACIMGTIVSRDREK
jgi:hypothetical protein